MSLVMILLPLIYLGLTRRILWVFMMIGNVCSCILKRHMEYDANLYEIRPIEHGSRRPKKGERGAGARTRIDTRPVPEN